MSVTVTIVVLLALTLFFVYSEWRSDRNRKNKGLDRLD